ncbi:hypothetical protein E2320_006910, partial [Naja naja]
YLRPTPPPESGYHRYQFLLYEQPAHEDVSLNPDETASSGDIYTFHCMSIENEWRRNSQAERQIMVADVKVKKISDTVKLRIVFASGVS